MNAKVVIESPLGAATVEVGYRPIASHLVCPMFMDDSVLHERRDGIDWPWMWEPDVGHLFHGERGGDSPGMVAAARRCQRDGIPYVNFCLRHHPECWRAYERGEWPPNSFGLGELFAKEAAQ